jgi:hypothetical protein
VTLRKKRSEDDLLPIDFDERGMPIGPNAHHFKTYLGTLVRSQVGINIDDWKQVDQGRKNTIWEAMQVRTLIIEKKIHIFYINY